MKGGRGEEMRMEGERGRGKRKGQGRTEERNR